MQALGAVLFGGGREGFALERAQARARTRRLHLADRPADGLQTAFDQFLRIEGRAAGQQLIEQHAQAVDVAARVNVQPAHLRLLGAHVGRRADELVQLRIDRRVGQPALGRLGDAEINHLGHRHAIVQRDQDVRGLDVAVDDALLVRVLDGVADLDEQVKPFPGAEAVLVAVVGDADAPDQFHDEVGAARLGGAGVEHLGDVGMVHHGQSLPLGLEARDHRLGVHAQLDDLQRHAPAHRFGLLGDIDDAATAFADFLQQLVAADGLARGVVLGSVGESNFDRGQAAGGGRIRERIRVLAGRQQSLEALAQRGVARTLTVQEGGALGGGLGNDQGEQGLFAFVRCWHRRFSVIHSGQ